MRHLACHRTNLPACLAVRRVVRLVATLSALAVLTACQAQTPSPAPTADQANSTPGPKPAAALPSPSPGLSVPSPVASPSPSPSPAVAAGANFALDNYPFAVMIDNIAEARPQFGLGAADVVYEAPAEAGIPRLMPVFLRA